MPQGKEWLKYLPPCPMGQQSSFNPDRHRRSSTESELDTRLESPPSRHHERSNTSTGLLLGQAGSYSRDHEIQPDDDKHSIRERRAYQARIAEPVTPLSTESTPVRDRNGRVFTDVPPPVFVHPVYGRSNPWDGTAIPVSPHLGRGRQNVRPRPTVRPIARVESPHLYRTAGFGLNRARAKSVILAHSRLLLGPIPSNYTMLKFRRRGYQPDQWGKGGASGPVSQARRRICLRVGDPNPGGDHHAGRLFQGNNRLTRLNTTIQES